MQELAGDSFHKCATSKTDTRHTKFSKVPCDSATQHCHCKVPCVKVPITAGSLNHAGPEQGATPRHTTAHWKPNRHPYTMIRPFFTQKHTIVPALVPSTTNHRSHSIAQSRMFQSTRTGNPRERPILVVHSTLNKHSQGMFPHSSFTL